MVNLAIIACSDCCAMGLWENETAFMEVLGQEGKKPIQIIVAICKDCGHKQMVERREVT